MFVYRIPELQFLQKHLRCFCYKTGISLAHIIVPRPSLRVRVHVKKARAPLHYLALHLCAHGALKLFATLERSDHLRSALVACFVLRCIPGVRMSVADDCNDRKMPGAISP